MNLYFCKIIYNMYLKYSSWYSTVLSSVCVYTLYNVMYCMIIVCVCTV